MKIVKDFFKKLFKIFAIFYIINNKKITIIRYKNKLTYKYKEYIYKILFCFLLLLKIIEMNFIEII